MIWSRIILFYCLLSPLISCSEPEYYCANNTAITCTRGLYYISTCTCTIYSDDLTAVNEGIKQCARDRVLALSIIVQTPLAGGLDLDNIVNGSVLYLNLQIGDNLNTSVKLNLIHDLPNIRTLAIGSYEIIKNTFFSHFPRLEKLSVRDASLPSLPLFTQLRYLFYLSLSSISFPQTQKVELGESSLRGLYLLKYLQISNTNRAVSMSGSAFRDLTSLSFLHLTNNSIRSISYMQFRGLSALRILLLADNKLSYLPYQAFQQLPSLTQINVSGNPFNCVCALQWMAIAEHTFNFQFNNPKCNNSHNITGFNYYTCPTIPVSLQCLNRSRPLCPSPLLCYDTATDSQCSSCPPGYGQVAESGCIDLDSCSRIPNPCNGLTCLNTPGSYICLPPSNPCEERNGGCEQRCEWNVSVHWCECLDGFESANVNSSNCRYVTPYNGDTTAVVFCVVLSIILIGIVALVIMVRVKIYVRDKRKRKLVYHLLTEEPDSSDDHDDSPSLYQNNPEFERLLPQPKTVLDLNELV